MAFAGLGSFLVAITGPVVKKAMIALGFGIVSYAAIATALNAALDQARNAWGGLGGDALALVNMSGASTALSIVAGALVARVSIMSLKKLEILR